MSIYTGFKAIIGANVTGYSGKIFPLVAPEGTKLPYATYQQIYSDKIKTHDGYDGSQWVDYQFNFYNNTYISSRTAAEQFISFVQNFRGTLGNSVVDDVEILNDLDDSDYVGSVIRYKTIVDVRFYINN